MFLQVTNLNKPKFNQIRCTKSSLFRKVKEMGWNISDCSVKELKDELVNTNYKSPDGKNQA